MTNVKPFISLAAMVVAGGVAATAVAQPVGAMLARADANGDGSVTRAEASDARAAMFERLDRNADGAVSADEREAARSRLAAFSQLMRSVMILRADRMDADGDGILTRAEFMVSNPMFERADRNGDGVIDPDEIARMRQQVANR